MRKGNRHKTLFRSLTDTLEKVAEPSSLALGIVAPEVLAAAGTSPSVLEESAWK